FLPAICASALLRFLRPCCKSKIFFNFCPPLLYCRRKSYNISRIYPKTDKDSEFKKVRDSMGSSKNDYSDLFDDDFEVTYEEDPGLTLDMYSSARKKKTAHTALEDTDPDMDFEDDSYDDFEDVDEDSDYDYDDDEEDYDPRRRRRGRNGYDDEDGSRDSGRRRRKSRGGVPLAAPIQKGGKLLSRLSGALLRQL